MILVRRPRTKGRRVETIHKTLLVARKKEDSLEFIYGQSIRWARGPLDTYEPEWRRSKCKQRLVVFLGDSRTDKVEVAFRNRQSVTIPVKGRDYVVPPPQWTHEETRLLPADPRTEYSPFISLATRQEILFPAGSDTDGQQVDDIVRELREGLQEIAKRFGVPMGKHPGLLGTFHIFAPTRLLIHWRGYDKGADKGLEVLAHDEFKTYGKAEMKLTARFGDQESTLSASIQDLPRRFTLGWIPDHVSIVIQDESAQQVYSGEAYTVKSISLETKILTSQIQVEGMTVPLYEASRTVIGGNDE